MHYCCVCLVHNLEICKQSRAQANLVFTTAHIQLYHLVFQQEECEISKAFKKGCLDVAVSAARDHAGIIGTAGVIVACIMVMLRTNC